MPINYLFIPIKNSSVTPIQSVVGAWFITAAVMLISANSGPNKGVPLLKWYKAEQTGTHRYKWYTLVHLKRRLQQAEAAQKKWYTLEHPVQFGTGIYTRDRFVSVPKTQQELGG